MTIQTLAGFLPFPEIQSRANAASITLDANGEKAAFLFSAPKTGTIDRVCFATGTVTTGDTVDVRLETIDGATGDPSGTLWGTNTNGAQVIADANDNGWFEVTLTAGASVTRGDKLAIVIALPASGSTGNLVIPIGIAGEMSPQIGWSDAHYNDAFAAAAWTKASGGFTGAVRYSDGTYPYVGALFAISSAASVTFSSASTPDERGNRLILPFGARAAGIWFQGTGGGTPDVTAKLYDSASNLLESQTVDATIARTTNACFVALFDTSVTLVAGSLYRISLVPGATSFIDREFTVASAALLGTYSGGPDVHKTTRTDAGAWTDTTTERVIMGLLLDGLDDGAQAYGFVG